jgi:hypothetical protein
VLAVEAKLARDNDLVPERRERLAYKLFVCIRTVDFGRVKKRDAVLMGCPNDLNALDSVRGGSVVGAYAHAPKSQF